MKHLAKICLCLIGSFSILMGVQEKNQTNEIILNEAKIASKGQSKCCGVCGCNQLLFKANLSECNIAEPLPPFVSSSPNEQLLEFISGNSLFATSIATGADFEVAFGGNDFSCSTIPRCGIEIRPANGSSFQKGVPPIGQDGPVPGGLFDHVKFLAYSLFRDAPTQDCELCTTWVGSGKQLQVDTNPFDGAVTDPHSDPRLACFGFVSLDPNTLCTFDWICTDKIIYALVERLPGGEGLFGDYAAYTYMIPVGKRKQKADMFDDIHTFKTCYNRENGTVTWKLDGRKVFQISQIGHRLTETNAFVFSCGKKKPLLMPTRFQVLDHGGTDQDVVPTGLQTGLSLFTLLDFYQPQTTLNATVNEIINSGHYEGLVRLESSLYRFGTTFYYNNPLQGGQEAFFADSMLVGTQYQPTIPSTFRLFGQGAALRLFDYTVSLEQSK